jgi:hypothetical protein
VEHSEQSISRDKVLLLIQEATAPLYKTLYKVEGGINTIKLVGGLFGFALTVLEIIQIVRR